MLTTLLSTALNISFEGHRFGNQTNLPRKGCGKRCSHVCFNLVFDFTVHSRQIILLLWSGFPLAPCFYFSFKFFFTSCFIFCKSLSPCILKLNPLLLVHIRFQLLFATHLCPPEMLHLVEAFVQSDLQQRVLALVLCRIPFLMQPPAC